MRTVRLDMNGEGSDGMLILEGGESGNKSGLR